MWGPASTGYYISNHSFSLYIPVHPHVGKPTKSRSFKQTSPECLFHHVPWGKQITKVSPDSREEYKIPHLSIKRKESAATLSQIHEQGFSQLSHSSAPCGNGTPWDSCALSAWSLHEKAAWVDPAWNSNQRPTQPHVWQEQKQRFAVRSQRNSEVTCSFQPSWLQQCTKLHSLK